jgi:hypothetical protein
MNSSKYGFQAIVLATIVHCGTRLNTIISKTKLWDTIFQLISNHGSSLLFMPI